MVPLLFILPSQERPLQVPVSTLRYNRRTCCNLTVLPLGHPASRRLSALLGSHVLQSPCLSPSSLHKKTCQGDFSVRPFQGYSLRQHFLLRIAHITKSVKKDCRFYSVSFSRIYLENIIFSSLNILVRTKVRIPA